jgi:hypothetical protein
MTTLPAEAVLLGEDETAATLDSIEAVQATSGMISWFEGGHCDPWNHVEAAMALSTGGRLRAAERAYEWLVSTQQTDGSWFNYYKADGSIEDARVDTNVCAYIATGVWHHYLSTGDRAFVEEIFKNVSAALDFVVSWQRSGGEVVWSIRSDGDPESYALLTGSSSIYLSLRCGLAAADLLGRERPDWELAAGRLRQAIAYRPELFAPKERYAMDWYYPVLTGAVTGPGALQRLRSSWSKFVMAGHGVRCVSDRPWVTAAETAECVLSCLGAGMSKEAALLFSWVQDQRDESGSYTTGRVYPERSTFPHEERSSYTAAAIVLANEALCGKATSSSIFLAKDSSLPTGFDIEETGEEWTEERLA